jgi:hypothetical protein
VTRHCEVCGEVLRTDRPDARHCSPRCRQTASRSARRAGSAVVKPQVSGVQSVTPPAVEGTDTRAVVPVTLCRCEECLDWAREPAGYWDRVTARILDAARP